MKNLSSNSIWQLAYLEGKDDNEMLKSNLVATFQELKTLKSSNVAGTSIRIVMPADMKAHEEITDAGGKKTPCFRCNEDVEDLDFICEIYLILEGETMRSLARKFKTYSVTLIALNTPATVNSIFCFSFLFFSFLFFCSKIQIK